MRQLTTKHTVWLNNKRKRWIKMSQWLIYNSTARIEQNYSSSATVIRLIIVSSFLGTISLARLGAKAPR